MFPGADQDWHSPRLHSVVQQAVLAAVPPLTRLDEAQLSQYFSEGTFVGAEGAAGLFLFVSADDGCSQCQEVRRLGTGMVSWFAPAISSHSFVSPVD